MKTEKTKSSWIILDLTLIIIAAFAVVFINMFIYDFNDEHFNKFTLFGLLFFSAQFYIERVRLTRKTGFWIPVLAIYYILNSFQYPLWSFFLMIIIFHSIADTEIQEIKNNKQENLDV